jgi:hypothetical protein
LSCTIWKGIVRSRQIDNRFDCYEHSLSQFGSTSWTRQ